MTKFMKTMGDQSIRSDARDEEVQKMDTTLDEIISGIHNAWEEINQHSTKKRNDLIKECNAYREVFRAEVRNIREKRDLNVRCISNSNDLIGKGVETVIPGQTLSVHDNLCSSLHELLASANTEDSTKAEEIARRVACQLTFTPYRFDTAHVMGELSLNQWRLEKENELVLARGCYPLSSVATRDGKLVVGYSHGGGGVEVLTADGSQSRKLQGVSVLRLSVLSNGYYVVRDWYSNISLYTQTWKKNDTAVFEGVGKYGGMDVDRCNHVYVGCVDVEAVLVFTPEGGAPVGVIPCPGYSPSTVCTMKHSELLVLSDYTSVRVVNGEGKVMYDVNKEGFGACVTVLRNDNILIGWWEADHVSIDLYTNQLSLIRRVLTDYRVDGYVRAIKEFSTGEIAVLNKSKLYIFRRRPVPLTGETS